MNSIDLMEEREGENSVVDTLIDTTRHQLVILRGYLPCMMNRCWPSGHQIGRKVIGVPVHGIAHGWSWCLVLGMVAVTTDI